MSLQNLKSLKMNSVPPISGQVYVHVEDSAHEAEQFYALYQRIYREFDFVCPLMALMKRARNHQRLSAQEKRNWVEEMHREIVQKAYQEESQKQMALVTGPALIDLFENAARKNSLYVRNPLLYYEYIYRNDRYEFDADSFANAIIKKMSQDFAKKNGIGLIETAYDTQFYYAPTHTVEGLCKSVLEKLKWSEGEIALFWKLFPFVIKGIEQAKNGSPFLQDPYEPEESCCCRIC